MSEKKVLVVGDSHTQALAKAHGARAGRQLKSDDVLFEINWLAKPDNSRGDLPFADALDRAASLGPDDVLVISVAGALHNGIGLLRHEKPFDFFTRDDETMTPAEGCVVVPENALWDTFKIMAEPNKKITGLRAKARCPAYHLATPPPKEDNDFIMARVTRYRDRLVAEAGVNAAATRLKLWKLEMRVLAHLCDQWSIRLLLPPAEAQTAEGFLKPEYWANDATHANAAYGELVLRQLEAVVRAASRVQETA
ncbi:MAG TPA: hypothetical protein VHP33_19795 [Polyangiaceae bacterium]|nr:hypothetical protein [Polyangiaceae bacterium]